MVNSQELALELFEGKLTKKDLLEFLNTSEYNEVIRCYEFLQKEKQWVTRQMVVESLNQVQEKRAAYNEIMNYYKRRIAEVNRLTEELAEKTRIAETLIKIEQGYSNKLENPFYQKVLDSVEEFINSNNFEETFYRLKEELDKANYLADKATGRYEKASAEYSYLKKRYEGQAALSTLSVVGSALADLANALQL